MKTLSPSSIRGAGHSHGAETQTNRFQIGPRPDNNSAPSKLAGFLTGDPRCQPSNSGGGLGYCEVQTGQFPDPQGCQGVEKHSRQFNDLLRRHLYLVTARDLSPTADLAKWREKLQPLSAYQVH